MTKISVVIPFLNESANIVNLCSELNSFFSSQKDFAAEVIFVDDGSSDDSVDLLKMQNHNFYEGKILKLSKNYGSHAALRAGTLNSTGDIITFIYADLQDPLELISNMYKMHKNGFDIVWATRDSSKNSFAEKVFSKMYASLMQRFAISSFPEGGFDVVMFNDKIKKELNDNIEANSSIFLQILSLGFKQTSISYSKRERKMGETKWTLSKKIKLFVDSFVAFSYAPIRLVTYTGLGFALIGFLWAAYILARAIFIGDLTPGWPALVAILMIGFGITNISLGMIAEYLWRTLDAARERKVFIIDEKIDLGKHHG
jgi:glycosyltransferase involved in cell wall biosynthesis